MLHSAWFQVVRRLFVFAYDATDDNEGGIKDNQKCFLPQAKIEDYNVLIHRRNFYDQTINDLIKQNDEVRKVSTGQGEDYSTECLLDCVQFKDNYRLITVDLSKQKVLGVDPRAIQQIALKGIAGQKLSLYTILEKSVKQC